MAKLSTKLLIGREDNTPALRLPGMNRESTVRQLRSNLGAAVASEKKPVPKAKGLGSASAPKKHEMGAFNTSKFGFGGPGSTEPI
jgi:hypothetical protein